ncbi:hypothetical protein CEXT_516821 [Caerostris extrusa]|uniref:Uncharacterized protein n=1 Tax=Caerostris extrusa TaxID=172846 RepID=A0AAV4MRY0_CAEEX|nr:hypothetical protein CEXT_516821 [Caerostris extrusa]
MSCRKLPVCSPVAVAWKFTAEAVLPQDIYPLHPSSHFPPASPVIFQTPLSVCPIAGVRLLEWFLFEDFGHPEEAIDDETGGINPQYNKTGRVWGTNK